MKFLNETTKSLIEDLQNDIDELKNCGSNIEVIWKMEKLQNDKVFIRSADLIRKSLR